MVDQTVLPDVITRPNLLVLGGCPRGKEGERERDRMWVYMQNPELIVFIPK